MSLLYLGILVLSAVGFAAYLVVTIKKNAPSIDPQLVRNLEIATEELETKKRLIGELRIAAQGLVDPQKVEDVSKQVEEIEEQVKAASGKITISEAEIEALDVRLRELNELKRELEISSLEAAKEIELLKSKERELAEQNSQLKEQLSNTYLSLDNLLSELANSASAVESLSKAKAELIAAEAKISYYLEHTAIINAEYVKLKRAYDALDIEYAQLYEKQQARSGM